MDVYHNGMLDLHELLSLQLKEKLETILFIPESSKSDYDLNKLQ